MSSAKMQPTDHMSIPVEYSSHDSRSSGARYQRVTTYSVMNFVSSWDRESPKSQILRSHVAFRSRLLGLRSRWRMLAEWMYLSPRRIW